MSKNNVLYEYRMETQEIDLLQKNKQKNIINDVIFHWANLLRKKRLGQGHQERLSRAYQKNRFIKEKT